VIRRNISVLCPPNDTGQHLLDMSVLLYVLLELNFDYKIKVGKHYHVCSSLFPVLLNPS